jgi:hypothetical protein
MTLERQRKGAERDAAIARSLGRRFACWLSGRAEFPVKWLSDAR